MTAKRNITDSGLDHAPAELETTIREWIDKNTKSPPRKHGYAWWSVYIGKIRGISYGNHESIDDAVKGFPGARFKKFRTEEEAMTWSKRLRDDRTLQMWEEKQLKANGSVWKCAMEIAPRYLKCFERQETPEALLKEWNMERGGHNIQEIAERILKKQKVDKGPSQRHKQTALGDGGSLGIGTVTRIVQQCGAIAKTAQENPDSLTFFSSSSTSAGQSDARKPLKQVADSTETRGMDEEDIMAQDISDQLERLDLLILRTPSNKPVLTHGTIVSILHKQGVRPSQITTLNKHWLLYFDRVSTASELLGTSIVVGAGEDSYTATLARYSQGSARLFDGFCTGPFTREVVYDAIVRSERPLGPFRLFQHLAHGCGTPAFQVLFDTAPGLIKLEVELNKVAVEDRGKKRLWKMAFHAVRPTTGCKHCDKEHARDIWCTSMQDITDACKRILHLNNNPSCLMINTPYLA